MTAEITTPGGQMALFDLDQFERQVPEPLWQHNARWLRLREPEKYAAIVHALTERMPLLTIATELRCSRHTVRAVRDSEPTLAHSTPSWLDRARQFRDRAIERLADEVDDLEPDKLPFAIGVIADKITLAEGGATQRIEHVAQRSPAEERLWREATGMGKGGEKMRQMRDVTPAPGLPVTEAEIISPSGEEPPIPPSA